MNRHAMTKHLILAAPLLFLAACSNAGSADNPGEPPLAGAKIGGPFELTSSAGKTVKWSDFKGKYRMVYFGYAYCPDVCPLDVQRMMKAYAEFAKAEPEMAKQLQPIFITVDPERDTPKVVGEFTHAFSDDLLGLTGTPEQIKQAAKAFSVYYAKGAVREDGSYLMDHSRGAYLMGRDGEPIALLPVDESPEAVTAELKKWVR